VGDTAYSRYAGRCAQPVKQNSIQGALLMQPQDSKAKLMAVTAVCKERARNDAADQLACQHSHELQWLNSALCLH
jgi:hypothetical protein